MKRLICLAVALMMLTGCACARTRLTMLNVGKGDALIVELDGATLLIDTGKAKASDTLLAALERMGISYIDAVFITHTDKDHTGGLKALRKSDVGIGDIYASKYYPESSDDKHPAVKAAKKLGKEVIFLGAGDEVTFGDTTLHVLAPIEEIPDNEDDNSLVMMLENTDGRILLCGDMEYKEEEMLLNSGADLSCDVLKVPNHGDSDACGSALVRACGAQTALISTNSEDKPGTPDTTVLANLTAAGATIWVTQDYEFGVVTVLDGGNVTTEGID